MRRTAHLMRILGPNSMGLLIPGPGLNASFAPAPAAPGPLAFLSQSGALLAAALPVVEELVAERLRELTGRRHAASASRMPYPLGDVDAGAAATARCAASASSSR